MCADCRCVIAELFSDGQPTFLLSQLLKYREKSEESGTHSRIHSALPNAVSPQLHHLLDDMLAADPKKRLLASQLLDKYRQILFPEYFYASLWPYLKAFTDKPLLTPDEMVLRLKSDVDTVSKDMTGEDSEGLLMVLAMGTSLVRGVRHLVGRMDILRLLQRLSVRLSPTVVLDRILPYAVYMLGDPLSRVRAEAIRVVAELLASVDQVPRTNVGIFFDYIFPHVNPLVHDSSSMVRMSLAGNIAMLAETATRFLEHGSHHVLEPDPEVQEATHSADSDAIRQAFVRKELQLLHETVQEMVVSLLCDPDNNIKRTLVRNGLPTLCVFFGRQKASDVLLSHMITFLNDKTDWRLRATFYECVTAAAGFIGWQSTLILKPLLQQGLRDFEELVVFRTLTCLSQLAALALLQKPVVYELLNEAVPFLSHPNEWLRVAAAVFVSSVAKSLNLADVHCKVMPLLSPYLSQALIRLDQEAVMIRCLRPALPRSVWDLVIRSALMSDLLDFLRDKHLLRQLSPGADLLLDEDQLDLSSSPSSSMIPENPQLAAFYRKLINQGLNDELEERLLAFRETLLKMRKMKASVSDNLSPTETSRPGVVDLSCLTVTRRHADLTFSRQRRPERRRRTEKAIEAAMNEEWQYMFGKKTSPHPEPHDAEAETPVEPAKTSIEDELRSAIEENEAEAKKEESDELIQSVQHSTIDTTPAMDKIRIVSSCSLALTELVEWKREEWRRAARFATDGEDSTAAPLPPSSWRPEGCLVAHLHEHRAAVQRLVAHPEGRYFGTWSYDGTFKLWDSRRLEGKNMANKSLLTYSGIGDRLRSGCFLADGDHVICAADNCQLQVLRLERVSARSKLGNSDHAGLDPRGASVAWSLRTDPVEEGQMLDLGSWTDGFSDLVVGVTHHGYLICWDLRSGPRPIWKWRNPSEHGMITAFCLDAVRQHWVCLGTATGRLVTWDLRFQLPVSSASQCHPSGKSVVRLWTKKDGEDVDLASKVWCSVAGNGELAQWSLETGERAFALWPSSYAPLSYQQCNSLSTTAAVHRPSSKSSFVITGDSAGAIKLWNLLEPTASYALSSPSAARSKFESRLLEGVEVVMEQKERTGPESHRALLGPSPDLRVTTWHRDSVSDLACCYSGDQWFLVSASRDGVIKVWK